MAPISATRLFSRTEINDRSLSQRAALQVMPFIWQSLQLFSFAQKLERKK